MYFVILLGNAFRERTCKHERKSKPYESSERWFNNPSLRKIYKPKECQKYSKDQVFSEIAMTG